MIEYIKMSRTEILDARTGSKLPRGSALDAAASFHARIFYADHACVGGQAALSVGALRFAYINHQLGTIDAAAAVLEAIDLFLRDFPSLKPPYRPLIICFKGPRSISAEEGHELTWATLHAMNNADRVSYSAAELISEDPQNEDFGFSWRDEVWFVNAGFPNHPRKSRDFQTPLWIINLQENFDLLRKAGWFDTIKMANAKREIEYQGSTNPVLADKGQKNQWQQVTSVQGQAEPKCPFQNGPKAQAPSKGKGLKKAS